jgi:hypothetical protein
MRARGDTQRRRDLQEKRDREWPGRARKYRLGTSMVRSGRRFESVQRALQKPRKPSFSFRFDLHNPQRAVGMSPLWSLQVRKAQHIPLSLTCSGGVGHTNRTRTNPFDRALDERFGGRNRCHNDAGRAKELESVEHDLGRGRVERQAAQAGAAEREAGLAPDGAAACLRALPRRASLSSEPPTAV